jgi:DNA-binding transcriptional ArsR family regulator
VRVAIYVGVAAADCPQNCSNYLEVSEKKIPKSTLSQHFKALREAGLVRSERCGVEMRNTTRCQEIEGRFPGLIKAIINAHQVQLAGQGRARRRELGNASAGRKKRGS